MSRLLVVSNRLPSLDAQASAGGLAVGLQSALEESGGVWLGWSGDVSESERQRLDITRADGMEIVSIDLTESEVDGYYRNFANRCLWPVLHSRLDLAHFDENAYRVYRKVNEKFAEAVAEVAREDDLIWVHDYHLISLARNLRRHIPAARVGFFVHVPFPPPEIFAAIPWARELAIDLLSYDLVGFQTDDCAYNFRSYLQRYLEGTVNAENRATANDRTTMTGVFPIGIDPESFAELSNSQIASETVEKIKTGAHETAIIAGVERLDYSKGIPERFEAFECFLERHPEYLGKVSLFQIAAPSRSDIPEYQSLVHEVEELAGHINGRFGTFEWTPIHFIARPMSQAEVAALYRASKVGVITPLRDGMNLVAKEYVAAQDPIDPGVLVLSQFAGAADELREALIINPYDTGATAEALRKAIEMPKPERIQRWKRMMSSLENNNIHHWRRGFLKALERASQEVRQQGSGRGVGGNPGSRGVTA